METLNVLVTSAVGEECLKRIADVSPRVKVIDVSDLLRAEWRGDVDSSKRLDLLLAVADVVFGLRLPRNIITRAPKLKWIQVMSAGVDEILDTSMLQSPVVLTNASGIHAVPIAEYVLSLMLMFVKKAPLWFELKKEREWRRFATSMLRSKTIGIVGMGSIGREVARLAKAFGMKVIATRRSVRAVGRARYVDIMLPSDRLQWLLEESDFVVLAVPLTGETEGLIGERELEKMKSSAYLINVTRGAVVHEEVLIRALSGGWIAGAGLDVFSIEPLPGDSKLWDLPNVILSSHIAGGMEDYAMRATDLFVENMGRYLTGKRLLNVVDKKRGY